MPRLALCKNCGEKLQPENKYMHASKSYCKKCYDKIIRDADEYKKLIEYICDNYQIEKPTGFIVKQIKDMKVEHGWTYAAMTYTLWYCKEILGKQFIVKYGVALIKHYYEEAEDYYTQQEKVKVQMEKMANVELTTKVVKQKIVKQNSCNRGTLIDLGNLF